MATPTPGAASAPPRPVYNTIQYLRGVAALMVVAWHALGQMSASGPMILQSGIEVFFIISGFIMWTISADDAGGPLVFMVRRAARIAPFYWGMTLFAALVAGLFPHLVQSLRLNWPHLAASLAFIAWTNPTPGVGLKPLLIPGWTLNYELAFYVLVAASLWLKGVWRPALVIGVLTGLATLGALNPSAPPVVKFYTAPLLLNFALGVSLAALARAAPARLDALGGPLFLFGFLGLLAGMAIDPDARFRLIWFSLPVSLIVLGAVLWERAATRPVSAPLKALGDASYPLYLVHTILLSALGQGWRRTPLAALPIGVFVGLGLAVSVVVGLGLHVWIEKPLTRFFQVRLGRLLRRTSHLAPEPAYRATDPRRG